MAWKMKDLEAKVDSAIGADKDLYWSGPGTVSGSTQLDAEVEDWLCAEMHAQECETVEEYEAWLQDFIKTLRPPNLQEEWATSIPDCPRELLGKLTSWLRSLPWPAGWVAMDCQRFTRREGNRNRRMVQVDLLKMTPANFYKIMRKTPCNRPDMLKWYLAAMVDTIKCIGLVSAAPKISEAIYLLEAHATAHPETAERVSQVIAEQRLRGCQKLEIPHDPDRVLDGDSGN